MAASRHICVALLFAIISSDVHLARVEAVNPPCTPSAKFSNVRVSYRRAESFCDDNYSLVRKKDSLGIEILKNASLELFNEGVWLKGRLQTGRTTRLNYAACVDFCEDEVDVDDDDDEEVDDYDDNDDDDDNVEEEDDDDEDKCDKAVYSEFKMGFKKAKDFCASVNGTLVSAGDEEGRDILEEAAPFRYDKGVWFLAKKTNGNRRAQKQFAACLVCGDVPSPPPGDDDDDDEEEEDDECNTAVFSEFKMGYQKAKEFCESANGTLVSAGDEEGRDTLEEAAPFRYDKGVWFLAKKTNGNRRAQKQFAACLVCGDVPSPPPGDDDDDDEEEEDDECNTAVFSEFKMGYQKAKAFCESANGTLVSAGDVEGRDTLEEAAPFRYDKGVWFLAKKTNGNRRAQKQFAACLVCGDVPSPPPGDDDDEEEEDDECNTAVFSEFKMGYKKAKAFCESANGTLVSAGDEEGRDVLEEAAPFRYDKGVWFLAKKTNGNRRARKQFAACLVCGNVSSPPPADDDDDDEEEEDDGCNTAVFSEFKMGFRSAKAFCENSAGTLVAETDEDARDVLEETAPFRYDKGVWFQGRKTNGRRRAQKQFAACIVCTNATIPEDDDEEDCELEAVFSEERMGYRSAKAYCADEDSMLVEITDNYRKNILRSTKPFRYANGVWFLAKKTNGNPRAVKQFAACIKDCSASGAPTEAPTFSPTSAPVSPPSTGSPVAVP